jgi:hypothetical protein
MMDMMFFYGSVVKRLEIILFVSVFSGRLSIFDAVSNFESDSIAKTIHNRLMDELLECLVKEYVYAIKPLSCWE